MADNPLLAPLSEEEMALAGPASDPLLAPLTDEEMQLSPAQTSPLEAVASKAGQTMAMGYTPQIAGALGSLMPDPNAELDKRLESQGFKVETGNPYLQYRDAAIQRADQLAAEHPGATAAGTGLGVVASLINPGATLGGKALASIGSPVARGMAMGAAYNPGDVEGQINPIQAGERLQGAAIGGAVGLGQKAVSGALSAGQGLARWLSGMRKPEAEAFAKAPEAVKSIAKALESGKESAVQTEAREIGKQGLEAIRATRQEAAQNVNSLLENKLINTVRKMRPKAADPTAPTQITDPSAAQQMEMRATPAKVLNRARQILDKKAKWEKGRLYSDSEAAAKKEFSDKANTLRKQIQDTVPETKKHFATMRDTYKVEKALKPKLGNNPDQVFKSKTVGSIDMLEQAEKLGAKGMVEYARQRAAADALNKGSGSLVKGVARFAGRAALPKLESAQQSVPGMTESGLRAYLEGKRK